MKSTSLLGAAILLCVIVVPFALGCNTFSGVGKDIQAGGRGLGKTADRAQHHNDDRRDAGHHQTISATIERNGSISPSGRTLVPYGSDRTYKIAAYKGHHITDVLVDGRSVGAVNRYRFDDVRADHNIDVLIDGNSRR